MTRPATLSPTGSEDRPADPCELYGPLLADVQHSGIFADQKTFVDCQPKIPPADIRARYVAQRGSVDLREFVFENFLVPEAPSIQAFVAESLDHHLETVWSMLRREPHPVPAGSSLLPLARPYVIPGGRFREIYYWDSYFAMIGLRLGGREALIRAITDNFADLLARFQLIPNGNRSYYLTRSQPPLLAAMVQFIAEQDGPPAFLRYLPALEAELAYWNDTSLPTRHSVDLPGLGRLHRYYDQSDRPRSEAFANDQRILASSPQSPGDLFRNLRTATESGWDFSSRWFVGGQGLEHTRTTDILPVDLNCFLLQLEQTLQRAYELAHRAEDAQRLAGAVEQRLQAIQQVFWSESAGFFCDCLVDGSRRDDVLTLGGIAPLFVRAATQHQADVMADTLRRKFLLPGGLVTTLVDSGEQWDWPNGWAPLQWLAVAGLRHYGHGVLAREIAQRWTRLNCDVFARTGRLMEKYDVVDLTLCAGGGEYPTQDGFAWTNGVLAQFRKDYPDGTVVAS